MKIGVSSYSFCRLVQNGTLSQLDVVSKAKEMGFDVIVFSTLSLPEEETALSFAPKLKEECDRVGIEIGSYTIGADFINGSNGNLDAEIERLKDEVRVAKILDVKAMRHDVTYGFKPEYRGPRGFEYALPTLVKGCRAVTEFAESLGIRTMVENHGFFCLDSERVERLINEVGSKNYGALIDIGNFLCADEDPGKAVGRMAPYAFHVHVKDFHTKPGTAPNPGKGWFRSRGGNYLRGAIIGHGDVPVVQCLQILKNAGYNGIISVEFEGLEEPLTGIAIGLENLRRYVNEIF
jgi:sugar phosphate isomerase/epimerase